MNDHAGRDFAKSLLIFVLKFIAVCAVGLLLIVFAVFATCAAIIVTHR